MTAAAAQDVVDAEVRVFCLEVVDRLFWVSRSLQLSKGWQAFELSPGT